jgi:polysaccharide export outer membrane protein
MRLLVSMSLAVALCGCASTPRVATAPKQAADPASLDSLALAKSLPPQAASAHAHAAPDRIQAASARAHAEIMPNLMLLTPDASAAAFEGEPPYTLDTGDKLRVVVFGQDGLTNSYTVDASGAITMPLISAVPARGLTTDELARAVGSRLRRGFVREPHVAIEVEVYRPFFILGEVTVPGQYAYVPHMTVENAIAVAGGFTPRAYKWDIRIDRPVAGGIARKSVPPITRVRPGDTVVVTERWF